MIKTTTVVLKLPLRDAARLGPFVEQCLAAGVTLIAVWGEGAAEIEDQIDDIVIGDGADPDRFLSTSAHGPGDDALDFALNWDNADSTMVVRL